MGSRQFRTLVVFGSILLPGAAQAQVELRGRVLTESGAPIPGATITLTKVGYAVRSDSLGEFRLSGQPGATIEISLRAAGYRDDTASVILARRGSLTRDFTLGSADVAPPEANPSVRTLRGLVQDESGQPLSYANIQLNFGRRFLADESGRFAVPYPGTGIATVIIRRIGFDPVELTLREMPDTSLRVRLKAIPTELEGVVVTGASAFRSLDLHGFYQRMKDAERGINHGYFITPEDLDRRKPSWITQMVEGFPTIRVCAAVSVNCPTGPPQGDIILGSRGCKMTVYLDNIRVVGKLGGRDDAVNAIVAPSHAAAMEIYPRAVNAPPQYQPGNGNCGVVLIWTK
jgi:carboxypeptidase family protein